ncbi:low-affinity glucose transporter HXT3 [Verticillium alfalfae VaMs.102]|uniref:Low-affinity glucose transporter HXT3 n=1 Tax=Verticillium alfalfae (strain VaMs.102 / ATCC MYA-4576 / FGSC 10136) TaxID=526221 RepID=C9SKV7_VERA1|nr:low-affinity glucose transporter HXT3 [Verticillium alfalfae VaMs.102]EEY19325.1 low-affinity glucose transporter HXT3 [Verticillium alfalfae VaMs.102]
MSELQGSNSEGGSSPKRGPWSLLRENPFIVGLSAFASLGGFLFGYDQGVVSGVLTMESFAATFPRINIDSGFKADWIGRKGSMLLAVVIFTIGSVFQTAANDVPLLFAGRAIAGFAVGMLTMIVPMYISELSMPEIRGTLVVMQQLSITLGILVSYWLEYATQYIGGTRCAPDIPYSGGTTNLPKFDPRYDVGPGGCTGQSDISWRIPFGLQILPALVLGIGMLFFPESPRFYLLRRKEDKALAALAKIRRVHPDTASLRNEYLGIKAEVLFEEALNRERYPGKTGIPLFIAQHVALISTWPAFKRLAIGCCVAFLQQFMGCNAIIYYAPTMFSQLGLSGKTSGLLATGVYGIVNTLSTLPALFLIDRVGRRPLLLCGAAGTFISLVVVGGIIGGFGESLRTNKSAGWAGIAFIYIYDINFSYSFAPIGWVLPSEIFNLGNRSKAMAITTSATWMSNFVIGLVTPDMLQTIGYGTYLFFAGFCAIAFFFTLFLIPETRGKSLEDMDLVFGDTAAHDEKMRLVEIAASMGLTDVLSDEKIDDVATKVEHHA